MNDIEISKRYLLGEKKHCFHMHEQKDECCPGLEVSKAMAMANPLSPIWSFEAINHAMARGVWVFQGVPGDKSPDGRKKPHP